MGEVDLFAPLLGDIEAIILCSFDFDLENKKQKQKSTRPPLLIKSCGGQPNNYFFRPNGAVITFVRSVYHLFSSECFLFSYLKIVRITFYKSLVQIDGHIFQTISELCVGVGLHLHFLNYKNLRLLPRNFLSRPNLRV